MNHNRCRLDYAPVPDRKLTTVEATESLTTITTPSERVPKMVPHEQGKTGSRVSLTLDLAEARAYWPEWDKPHAPILAAFGAERLHECKLDCVLDWDRAVSENANALFRSIHTLSSERSHDTFEWDNLTFQFGHLRFLSASRRDGIVGYASTPTEAEGLVTWFSKKYSKPASQKGGVFNLIQQDHCNITCQEVSLSPETILSDEAIDLHYGRGSVQWHQGLIERFSENVNGLSIFEGSPGTGKTCYIRHLMGVLKESHRFYFIPTPTMGVLSRSDFIGFWANQRRLYSKRKFVVVLEDSDVALMTRGSDNREQVSAILNLSDGMLADFLQLQIICTINCTANDIDQALLRPGRLLCHRVFHRLDYSQAVRLAESLGRKLPSARDYSLAEVFAGDGKNEINRPHIGFGA